MLRALAIVSCALGTLAAPPSPSAVALQAALDAAVAANATSFTLPAGVIAFNGANFNVSRAAGIAIGGASNATVLVFEPGYGMAVSDVRASTLHDFSIDYTPLPYVFAPVVSVNETAFVVELDAASLTFEELVARFPPHDNWPAPAVFRAGALVRSVCGWGAKVPATPLAGSPRKYHIACHGQGAAPGDVFVAATRVGITLSLSRCAAVTVRDVHVRAAGYMAVTEFQGDGGNVYERVRVVAPSAARPLASNADGFHSSGARAGPRLDHVEIRGLLDDYFNVHNTLQLYIGPSWPGAASHSVGDYQLFAGGNTNYGTQTTLDRVAAGEVLSFFPLNVFSYPPLATRAVASIVRVDGAAAAALLADAYARASAAAQKTPCSACHVGLNAFSSAQLWNVTFATLLAGVSPLSLSNADGISAAGAVVAGCSFSDSITNLGRLKSVGSRIERTTWARTGKQNLEIMPLQNWLEGPCGIHNVTIDSCVFHGTTVTPVHVFGAVDVVQTNNSFLPEL
jgi:hypothetical protein